MAVPRNGMMEEDDSEEDNALFEEDGVNIDLESETPPHLRDLAAAAQLGDVHSLRLALGLIWLNYQFASFFRVHLHPLAPVVLLILCFLITLMKVEQF